MPLRDFVYAGRTLRKSPVFAVTAVATIALGIGASTAIFSVTNTVLLQPLPYKDAGRLVLACSDLRKRNVRDFPFSNEEFIDLRDTARDAFEDFAAVVTFRQTLPREDGSQEQVRGAAVTTNFFRMMGGRIAMGRDFIDADGLPQPQVAPVNVGAAIPNPPPGPPPLPLIAILSHDYFQRRYGGDAKVIGQTMRTNGNIKPQIVGVLAPGFELYFPPDANVEQTPDYWVANRLAYNPALRNQVSLRVIGRLKPGITLERAQATADRASAEEQRIDHIVATADYHIRLEPMQQHLVAEVRPAILALMGAVTFLLVIACANVATLLLVRASLRERELALRNALGGSRWRLIRQMLAEALLIAFAGTILGVWLASIGIHELHVIAPANLPRLESITLDPAVLGFTALAGLAAAAIFGIVPALRAARPDVMSVLRASGRTASLGGGHRLRNSVVVAEVALCFVLLIGSGLMFRSFLALQQVNPGFDPHHLLTFQLLGGAAARTPQERAALTRAVQDRLAHLPGIQSVTCSFPLPLAGGFSPIRWGLEAALADASKFQAVDFQVVLPGYFDTMRTPILEGRAFNETDNVPERNVAIVDQVLAAKAFPYRSAVGKRILVRVRSPQPEWVDIIGVAAHQRQTSLADPGREQVYFTDGFLRFGRVNRWALRTAGSPAQYASEVRGEIAKLNPQFLITEMQPMDSLVVKSQAGTRFSLLLIGVFATIAGLLAGVGLYGVLSTLVRQRTSEIGVRMALGAGPLSIFRLIVGHGMVLSLTGIAIGLGAALTLTRVMTSMLVEVKPTDPATYAAMVALFLLIAAIASWAPAIRAAALDPTDALREE